MKLEMEIMPNVAHGVNLRTQIRPCRWQKLRKEILIKQEGKCAICGRELPLQLHEKWKYKYEENEIILQEMIGLCRECHAIKHYARSCTVFTDEDLLVLNLHFCLVNKCTNKEMEKYIGDMHMKYQHDNSFMWKVTMGKWQYLVDERQEWLAQHGRMETQPENIRRSWIKERKKLLTEEGIVEIEKDHYVIDDNWQEVNDKKWDYWLKQQRK